MPDVVTARTPSPVTNGGTITFRYPALRAADSYVPGAILFPRELQNTYLENVDFTLAYGELQVVLTWINTSVTIPGIDATKPRSNENSGLVSLQLPLLSDTIREDIGNLAPLQGGDSWFFS